MYDRIHLMLTVYYRYTVIYKISNEYLKNVITFVQFDMFKKNI